MLRLLAAAAFILSLTLTLPSLPRSIPEVHAAQGVRTIQQRAKEASVELVVDGAGSGTAFAVERVADGTLFLTAKHVYRDPSKTAHILVRVLDGPFTTMARHPAKLVKIHADDDLAIVHSPAVVEPLPLAPRAASLTPGEDVLSAGFPSDTFPALVTIGSVHMANGRQVFHSASLWFGFSGGPLISAVQRKVFGVNVSIYCDRSGNPMSDMCRAVGHMEIWRFLDGR